MRKLIFVYRSTKMSDWLVFIVDFSGEKLKMTSKTRKL